MQIEYSPLNKTFVIRSIESIQIFDFSDGFFVLINLDFASTIGG